jgi:hypothetical protein
MYKYELNWYNNINQGRKIKAVSFNDLFKEVNYVLSNMSC